MEFPAPGGAAGTLGRTVWLAANPNEGRWNLVAVPGMAVVGYLAGLVTILPGQLPPEPPAALPPDSDQSTQNTPAILPFPGRPKAVVAVYPTPKRNYFP